MFDHRRRAAGSLVAVIAPQVLGRAGADEVFERTVERAFVELAVVALEEKLEALRVRDDLRTYSGASATVQEVDRIHLDQDFLRKQPSALPIRIPANAFGPGRPSQDMLLSPGQEICPDAHVATTFVKANELRSRFNPDLAQATGLTYFRIHCGTPAIVRVDGIWIRIKP